MIGGLLVNLANHTVIYFTTPYLPLTYFTVSKYVPGKENALSDVKES